MMAKGKKFTTSLLQNKLMPLDKLTNAPLSTVGGRKKKERKKKGKKERDKERFRF